MSALRVAAWAESRLDAEWHLAICRAGTEDYQALRRQTDEEIKGMLRLLLYGMSGLVRELAEAEDMPAIVGQDLARLVGLAREVAVELGWQPEREAITSRTRTLVYRRDGYACVLCGADDVTRLSIDHKVPVDLGGGNDPANLRTLCRACNSAKGARL